jgi:uncharacterized membrane protein
VIAANRPGVERYDLLMTDALTETQGPAGNAAETTATIAPPVGPDLLPPTDEPPSPADGEETGGIDERQARGDLPDPYAGGSFGSHLIGPVRRLYDRVLLAPVESFLTFFVVVFCVGFVFMNLHPNLLFTNNTPAGGDMGAHVWGPAYMRDHLLSHGRLTGWTPDWYDGFPAYEFYMVVPSLVIALLSFVMPYGIAFKLVAVSGCITLPICAWAMGKLMDLPFPAPPLFAVAATVYLFDRSFSIYGGNIPSTLAGEFSFSISLSFAILFLGVYTRALRTGKHRAWAAILLALCGLCHLIPLFFAVICSVLMAMLMPGLRAHARERIVGILGLFVGGGLIYLATPDKGFTAPPILGPILEPSSVLASGFKVLGVLVIMASLAVLAITLFTAARHLLYVWFPVMAVGGLLTAWWTVPFYLNHKYMTDMGWEKVDKVKDYLFTRDSLDPQLVDSPPIKWLLILAGAGALLSLIWWRRGGVFWLMTAVTFALLFVYMPEGRLWNARLLPFYYLALYFLCAVGIAEISRLIATLFAPDVNRPLRAVMALTAVGGLAFLLVVALPLRNIPGGNVNAEDNSYSWGPFTTTDSSFIDSWAQWNFTGYEGKAAYPEYYGVMSTMQNVGQQYGCGRAMWEQEEQHDRYGTPMAMMLLPYFTNGCIGSMEGLYFEASATTPYHFIDQDELSVQPSNAERDLPYDPGPPTKADFDLGIQHLKMLGVKYYMAISDGPSGMVAYGKQNPDLTQIATSGPWTVFEINNGNAMVEPLKNQPAVVDTTGPNLSQDYQLTPNPDGSKKLKTGSPWQFMAMDWYMDPNAWNTYLAADGPPEWQRVARGTTPDVKPEPTDVSVSNIQTNDEGMSFDVTKTGVPMLVKMSYFPNWKATGAEGPYRVTPNLMVVVPTSNHVELHYGYTGVDYLSWILTILGLIGVVYLFKARPVRVPDPGDPNELLVGPMSVPPPGDLGPIDPFGPGRGPPPSGPPLADDDSRYGWGTVLAPSPPPADLSSPPTIDSSVLPTVEPIVPIMPVAPEPTRLHLESAERPEPVEHRAPVVPPEPATEAEAVEPAEPKDD